MVVLLRSRSHLRCLLGMALLAWLMLAVAPLGAWPRAAARQASAMTAHASHDSMAMGAAGCCDDHGSQPAQHATDACHCALPCMGVLPAALAGLAAPPVASARYASPPPIEAPLSGFAPPLRPPLA